MNRSMKSAAAAMLAMATLSAVGFAAPVEYQPGEEQSTDVFVYQFPMAAEVDLNAGGYGQMLPVLVSESNHDMESLIRFDLAAGGIALDGDERAVLRLHVGDFTTGFGLGGNPSPDAPTNPTVDFYLNTSVFTEATKWTTRPSIAAAPVASVVVNDVNQWVEVDITDAVAGWLADPAGNFGLSIRQRSLVTRDGVGKIGVLFDSSATANAPILAVVPEPASIGLLAGGLMLAMRRRRRLG